MMRDIVGGAVESQADLMVVGTAPEADLEVAIACHAPDVVIMGDRRLAAARLGGLLVGHPRLQVAVITGEGRAAQVYRLGRVDVAELSPASLVEAIRASLND